MPAPPSPETGWPIRYGWPLFQRLGARACPATASGRHRATARGRRCRRAAPPAPPPLRRGTGRQRRWSWRSQKAGSKSAAVPDGDVDEMALHRRHIAVDAEIRRSGGRGLAAGVADRWADGHVDDSDSGIAGCLRRRRLSSPAEGRIGAASPGCGVKVWLRDPARQLAIGTAAWRGGGFRARAASAGAEAVAAGVAGFHPAAASEAARQLSRLRPAGVVSSGKGNATSGNATRMGTGSAMCRAGRLALRAGNSATPPARTAACRYARLADRLWR